MHIDTVEFFTRLATEMNSEPERYRVLGSADTEFAIVMTDGLRSFAVRICFDDLRCEHVVACAPSDKVDFSLIGSMEAWQSLFDNITANGKATGLQTINSSVLLGEKIELAGDDPMGLDKFSRFNQTIQEFLDGAARAFVPTM